MPASPPPAVRGGGWECGVHPEGLQAYPPTVLQPMERTFVSKGTHKDSLHHISGSAQDRRPQCCFPNCAVRSPGPVYRWCSMKNVELTG